MTAVVTLDKGSDHIALVTLNRPQARNAIDGAVASALEAIVDTTERDAHVRAVVLTGAGSSGVFCAGADLKAVAAGQAQSLFTARGGFAGFVDAARSKPWIAAVNGKALAGGFEIVLACDLIVAAEDGAFGLPEVSRGLTASAGGIWRLPRALPRALALELIVTADAIDARTAYRHGLVNRLVPADRVLDEALALARRIVRNAPLAVRESLAIARRAHELDDDTLRTLCAQSRARIEASDDYREGPLAFIEKREPRWSGR